MPRNIFIIGPHCTGKTTLVQAITTHYSNATTSSHAPAVITEQVREVMRDKNFSTKDFGTENWILLQQTTLEAQIQAEEALENQWFVSDRSVLDPIVYAQMMPQFTHQLRETKGWSEALERMRNGVVVICEAGQKSWRSDDAVRVKIADDGKWEEMNVQFTELAKEVGVFYHLLSKEVVDIEERLKFVLDRLVDDTGIAR